MALNIMVETTIKPFSVLVEEDYVYNEGVVIFDKEGYGHGNSANGTPVSGVKIGDGITSWKKLPYLNVTESVVAKWRQIAEGKGITNGKLVTLPDMNFAYMVVDVEKNSELVDEIMQHILKSQLYYTLSKKDDYLHLQSNTSLDFSLPSSQATETVEGITFAAKENSNLKEGQKTFLFKDAIARQQIKETKESLSGQINSIINSNDASFARINIKPLENQHNSQLNFYLRNHENSGSTGSLFSRPSASIVFADGYRETADSHSQPYRLYFNLYHKSQGDISGERIYTQYRFPDVEDLKESKVYYILTTTEEKGTLPIEKGGTNATNAKTAAGREHLNVVYKGSDADENSSAAGQVIYTNLSVKDHLNGKSIILAYDKSDTASATYKRGLAIGGGNNEWVVYAKTVDNEVRYCLGNDNVRVLQGNSVLRGAAWNDYAEAREANTLEAGRVVVEKGDGSMVVSTERLMPSAKITSDTFGFIIGETKTCKTPIAVCGRVLAYPNEDRNIYSLGDAVCSGPNGTVSKMTREEIINYPERIVGTVSEIPDYEVWGEEKVKVNGRIWIYVK